MILLSVVVFPAPFLPIKQIMLFSAISMDTSLKMWLVLIKTLIVSTSRIIIVKYFHLPFDGVNS